MSLTAHVGASISGYLYPPHKPTEMTYVCTALTPALEQGFRYCPRDHQTAGTIFWESIGNDLPLQSTYA